MNRRDMLRTSSLLAGVAAFSGKAPLFHSPADFAERSVIEPFHIDIHKDSIEDLHRRIDKMIWPEMPFDTGWSAGTNDRVLRGLVHYWRHEYNWYQVQNELNSLDHFRVPIEGEKLHFVRYKGQGKKHAFPLLLLHGWPSSFIEFVHAVPLLADGMPEQPGFDLIVPSLPGFVFSEAPRTPGMHVGRVADRMHALMQSLGYAHYGVQGGDWGMVLHEGSLLGGSVRFAYFGTDSVPGGLIYEIADLIEPPLIPVIEMIEGSARNWDGKGPIRELE